MSTLPRACREQRFFSRRSGGTLTPTIGFARSARCTEAYRLNKFLHELIKSEKRLAFIRDSEEAFARAELPQRERDFVGDRDRLGMIRYGVIFFVLEKLAAAAGISQMKCLRGDASANRCRLSGLGKYQDPLHRGRQRH